MLVWEGSNELVHGISIREKLFIVTDLNGYIGTTRNRFDNCR